MTPPPALPLHILLVDDDPVLCDLLSSLMTVAGHTVAIAHGGADVVPMLGSVPSPFDAVLTDINMPVEGGRAIARRLRSRTDLNLLLLGMSGNPPTPEDNACFDAFLQKPFDLNDLAVAVQTATHRRGPSPTSFTPTALAEHTSQAEHADPESPVLNDSIFQRLSDTLPRDALRQFYDLTLQDVATRLAHMRGYHGQGNWQAIREQAHAIKGSCGMVGASELSQLAACLEISSDSGLAFFEKITIACNSLHDVVQSRLRS